MIFAKPGDSQQQFGGSCPLDWIEMTTQRPDGDGWVANENGTWHIPEKTMDVEIKDAQDVFNASINSLNQAWLAAAVRGGSNEASKKLSIANEIAYVKKEHTVKISEIKYKHGA